MSSFWEKVRHYANQKVRQQYMERVRHDRRCPNCNMWTSEVGGAHEVNICEAHPFFEFMQCRQCGYKSIWDCRGMMPELAENQPTHTPKIGKGWSPDGDNKCLDPNI